MKAERIKRPEVGHPYDPATYLDRMAPRHTLDPQVDAFAIATYAYKAQIERNEAERGKPQPVITPILLIVFALAVFAVNLAVFGKGAW